MLGSPGANEFGMSRLRDIFQALDDLASDVPDTSGRFSRKWGRLKEDDKEGRTVADEGVFRTCL
jgi:hypothetical protein